MIKKNNSIVLRNIHDKIFLIDITESYLDEKCTLYEINTVGAFIWHQIDNFPNISMLAEQLKKEFKDVEYKILYQDILEYINILQKEGFLKIDG